MARLIQVAPQPEPAHFDTKVRRKGNAWLTKKGLSAHLPLPKGSKPPSYWRACLAMNARKRAFDDVLDPFTLPADVFHLELITGRIFVNPALAGIPLGNDAQDTIARLHLDSGVNKEIRARHFAEYIERHRPPDMLARYSPFVWAEVQRQGLA